MNLTLSQILHVLFLFILVIQGFVCHQETIIYMDGFCIWSPLVISDIHYLFFIFTWVILCLYTDIMLHKNVFHWESFTSQTTRWTWQNGWTKKIMKRLNSQYCIPHEWPFDFTSNCQINHLNINILSASVVINYKIPSNNCFHYLMVKIGE